MGAQFFSKDQEATATTAKMAVQPRAARSRRRGWRAAAGPAAACPEVIGVKLPAARPRVLLEELMEKTQYDVVPL